MQFFFWKKWYSEISVSNALSANNCNHGEIRPARGVFRFFLAPLSVSVSLFSSLFPGNYQLLRTERDSTSVLYLYYSTVLGSGTGKRLAGGVSCPRVLGSTTRGNSRPFLHELVNHWLLGIDPVEDERFTTVPTSNCIVEENARSSSEAKKVSFSPGHRNGSDYAFALCQDFESRSTYFMDKSL